MKKILLIAPLSTVNFGKSSTGGVDSVCQNLLRELVQKKNTNYLYKILAFNPNANANDPDEIFKIKNIEIIITPARSKTGLIRSGLISQAIKIAKISREFAPDIIHAHAIHWIISPPRNTITIASAHGYKWIGRTPSSWISDLLHTKIIPSLSDHYIDRYTCVGEKLRSAIRRDSKKPIDVVYNPIDHEYFSAFSLRRRTSSKTINLVTCSMLTERKNVALALKITSQLKSQGLPVTLTIIGGHTDPKQLNKLVELSKKLQIEENITYTGHLNKQQIIEHYLAATLGIFCSTEETFGLVPIEMLATGLPLLTTSVGILQEQRDIFAKLGVQYIEGDNFSIEDAMIMNLISTYNPQPTIAWLETNFSARAIVNKYENLYSGVSQPHTS